MKNSKGFTLLEMLLVLFIVLLISSIVFQITMKVTERHEVDQFFQQLLFDIQEMQALAIEKEESIIIQFNTNQYKAYRYLVEGEIILQKDMPENIQFDISNNIKRIRISPNGEVAEFGSIIFKTPFGQTNLIIYIKEGRMRLVEY